MNEKDETKKSLREPLLGSDQEKGGRGPPPFGRFDDGKKDVTYLDAMKKIFGLAIFPMIGMMFHPSYHLCNSIILGQKDPQLQAALGLGSITLSIFLLSIGVSFNGSLDTLVAQAYGQKDLRLCQVYLNRQLYLTTMVYVPLALFLFFACEPIYVWMGQDPYIAAQAATFVKICIPGVLGANWGTCYTRYLSGQRDVAINMISTIGGSFIHFFLAWLFAVYLQWDMFGIALASSIQFVSRFIICQIYIQIKGTYKDVNVPLWHEDSFKNLKDQFILSLQCASLGIWSWIAFDIFTVFASYMSINQLAAQTILRNIGLLLFMVPVALAMSTGILVGNMIGSGNIEAAQLYIRTSTLSAIIWAFLSVMAINALRGVLIDIFTSDPLVKDFVLGAYLMLSFFVWLDCLQGVAQGIIRGMGKQGRASIGTLIGYWVIGIPISYVAVFSYDGGLTALWLGITVACVFNSIYYYAIVYRTDMNKLSIEAGKRRQKETSIN